MTTIVVYSIWSLNKNKNNGWNRCRKEIRYLLRLLTIMDELGRFRKISLLYFFSAIARRTFRFNNYIIEGLQ